ncbi:hypothetical protein HDU86_005667 [Geranomyces michiganensis]|nr:hypothetical protein HDU86_005667 [Geranomyces michiganensis]
MPGLFSFGERKASLASKKSKKELKVAAAASAQAAKTIPSSPALLSVQLPTMIGISAPILPPKPTQAKTTTFNARRRARPLFDPVALATTSTQKLTYERQRGSSNMRKMVLVQNLLNEVYHTWHALMEKPAPQVAAEAFDFEEVADLEAPVDELLQGDLVQDSFNGRIKRRASLSWRRQGADSAVDLSAALRAHMEAGEQEEDEGSYGCSMSDSSDEEEEEDDEPPPRAPSPQPKPGRRIVRRVKSDSTISVSSPEDDEVPLGHLPFASDHIKSRDSPGSVPALPVALPVPPPIASAAAAGTKRAAHSPLRHAGSLDNLKSANSSSAPLTINTASTRLAKPAMTLIERMEQRERETRLLETPHSADSVQPIATSAAEQSDVPPAPLSAPAQTVATASNNNNTSTSPTSLLKKSLELVRGGRKSSDGSGKSKRTTAESEADDVPPPPDTAAPIPPPAVAPAPPSAPSAPAAASVLAPAPLPYLTAPHLQPSEGVKKKSSLINLKSVFGRRKAAPLGALSTASNVQHQPSPPSPPAKNPAPPTAPPKSVVLAVEALPIPSPQSVAKSLPPPPTPPPTRASPPPLVSRTTLTSATRYTPPAVVPCAAEPPLPVPRPRTTRSGRSTNITASPSFLASWQPPSQTPTKTNSLPLPTLDFSAGSFGADILEGFATSESVRRSFFLVDAADKEHQKQASLSFLDSAFDFSWDLTL